MTAFKVLIVEDSGYFRQLLKETLQSGFPEMEILEAVDGEQALKKITALLPHLVFMDIRLPGESGLEITRKIKAQYPDISVIILTSYDLPEYREAAKRSVSMTMNSTGSLNSSRSSGITRLLGSSEP